MERRYSLLPSYSENFILNEEGFNINYSNKVNTHSFKNLNSFILSKFPQHVSKFKKFIQTFYLPLIDFYLKYPNFNYYWQLEDDLVFNGDFTLFFNSSLSWDHDFIGCYADRSDKYSVCLSTPEHAIYNYKVSAPLAFGFVGIQRWSNQFLRHMVNLLENKTIGHVESFPLTVAYLDNFKVGLLNELSNMYNSQYCDWNTQFQSEDFSSLPHNHLIHSLKLNKDDKLFIHRRK